jgi:hypothetical protein
MRKIKKLKKLIKMGDEGYFIVADRVKVFFVVPLIIAFGWLGMPLFYYIGLDLCFLAGFTIKYLESKWCSK